MEQHYHKGEGSRGAFIKMSERDDVRRHAKDLKSVQNKYFYCTQKGTEKFQGNSADEIQQERRRLHS